MMKACAYARVSTMAQKDEVSLDTQIEAVREYAESRDYQIVREIKEVFSGAELIERPLLSDVREQIRQGEINALIVYDVDRLSRNIGHLAFLMEECARYNASLLFVRSEFTESFEGKLLFTIQSAFAEKERLTTIERTTRGRKAKAKIGTLSFRRKLFGYRLDADGKREFDPVESKIVVRLFADYLGGKSLREIAAELNAEQIPTPTGKPFWWAQSVRAILENPAYAGRTTVNRQKKIKKYKNGVKYQTTIKTEAADQIEIPAPITPALITEEDFQRVQKQFAVNKKAKKGLIKHEFLLRGRVKCGRCGRQMSPVVSRVSRAYVCTSQQNPTLRCGIRQIQAQRAEEAVWKQVSVFIKNPRKLQNAIKRTETDSGATAAKRDAAQVEKMIRQTQREISTLIERGANVSDDIWLLIKEKIEVKRGELSRLKTMQAELNSKIHSVIKIDGAEVNAYILKMRPRLNELSFAEKETVLETFSASCVWDGETLTLSIGEKQYYGKSDSNGLYANAVFLPLIALGVSRLRCA